MTREDRTRIALTILLALTTPAVALVMPYPPPGPPPPAVTAVDVAAPQLDLPHASLSTPVPTGSAPLPKETEPAQEAGPAFVPAMLTDTDGFEFRSVIVTGYASNVSETDSTPDINATMTYVRQGSLALSRDLLRTFTPGAPFDFGDWVMISGIGIFVVDDVMHERWRNCADIWFPDRKQAIRWGRRRAQLARLNSRPEKPGLLALGPLGWDFR